MTNLLIAESVEGAVVTDTLPDGLVFVSADNGGAISGQNPVDGFGDRSGGTITWNLAALNAAGIPTASGSTGSGSTGSSIAVTVTVRVSPFATGDVINTAAVVAPDPAADGEEFTDDVTDVDGLYLLDVLKTSDAPASGARAGGTTAYTVVVRNEGTAAYVGATIADDLTDVLDEATFVARVVVQRRRHGSGINDPIAGLLAWVGT